MKKFLTILILILTFQTQSQADDIRDFQIEGMSIGDSLLDFVNEDKILKELERNKDDYHWTDGKFGDVYIYEETENYEYISASVKIKDKKYIIYSVRGMIDYEDVNVCFKKQKEISDQIQETFSNAKKRSLSFGGRICPETKLPVFKWNFLICECDT